MNMPTISALLDPQGAIMNRLATVSASPRLDLELLLCQILDQPRAWLLAHNDLAPDEQQHARLATLLERRIDGTPMAYLLGRRGFHDLEFAVGPGVLVPRPETELIIELALASAPDDTTMVADLGTGCGAIAATLAGQRPMWTILAVERSCAALAWAQRNLAPTGVHLIQADWDTAFADASLDLLVSNPPYIAAHDPHLEALGHEPIEALVSGSDGLDALRQLAHGAGRVLRGGGAVLLEHGADQGAAVRLLLAACDFENIATHRDTAGHERVSIGHKRRRPARRTRPGTSH